MNLKGVIFDLGSTLLEYENIPWDTLNTRCLEAGYAYLREEKENAPPFDEIVQQYVKIRSRYRKYAAETLDEWIITDAIADVLKSAGLNSSVGLANRFFEAYYRPVSEQLTLFADTPYVLEELKKNNLKIGLVSNTIFPESYHLDELKKFNLIRYFDFTIFSSTFGRRKPHRSIFNHAVELSGLPAQQLLFIGDRYIEDYSGPKDAGLQAIIKYREGRDYPDPMPDDVIVVKSLSEMLPLILNEFDDRCRD